MTWCRLGLQNINQWCNRNGWLFIICTNFREILELEQNIIKQIHSLERSGHSRHNIIEVFYRWAWFWTNGKQQKVYSKYWNQKHRSSGLFHGNICDATTGVACICDCAGAGVTGQWKIKIRKLFLENFLIAHLSFALWMMRTLVRKTMFKTMMMMTGTPRNQLLSPKSIQQW